MVNRFARLQDCLKITMVIIVKGEFIKMHVSDFRDEIICSVVVAVRLKSESYQTDQTAFFFKKG